MSTALLSFRHYSAIRVTLHQLIGSNLEQEKAYIWPLVNLQREKGLTYGKAKDFITEMVQSMYSVNRIAYEYDNDETCEIEAVVFEKAPVLTPIELFKALDAWRYNSLYTLEGDDIILSLSEKEGMAMYLAVEVLHAIAEKLVKATHEYEKAAWAL